MKKLIKKFKQKVKIFQKKIQEQFKKKQTKTNVSGKSNYRPSLEGKEMAKLCFL